MTSDKSLTQIKGIGPSRAEAFGRLGLFSIDDVLHFMPRTYHDYSKATLVISAEDGADAAFALTILDEPKTAYIRRGMVIVSVRAADDSGVVTLTWFNQPYRRNTLHAGDSVIACGVVSRARGIKLISPAIYKSLPGVVPVYPLTKGISSAVLAKTVQSAFDACGTIEETLPRAILDKYALCPLDFALRAVHFPKDAAALSRARYRLMFEDMLMLSLMLSLHRRSIAQKNGVAFRTDGLLSEFLSRLPYAPTRAQSAALAEVEADMRRKIPMNRLIQGDVGSGKTVIALFVMFVAMKNGCQSALMAPTEILAEQHCAIAKAVLGDSVALLTGSMKKKERDAVHKRMAAGEPLALIGTHALLFDDDESFAPAAVIADEQHRFGVGQRARIGEKGARGGAYPDVLIMSATPIPRTLSLILYGDLDVSVLDELPPGRKPIKTLLVPESKRRGMYGFIEEQAKRGFQAYVVCPLVEESENLDNVRSAAEVYKELSGMLSVRTGLLHGQMSAEEKERVARRFRDGEIDVLVSTTVIEVGVDVKNATVMAIENADRFGLAQLHQLRGRVGRGEAESYCFLLSTSKGQTARERLTTLTATQDGFEIAEKDLLLRGAGEFLGTRQHGDTDFSNLLAAMDASVLSCAREAADMLTDGSIAPAEAERVLSRAREKLKARTERIALN